MNKFIQFHCCCSFVALFDILWVISWVRALCSNIATFVLPEFQWNVQTSTFQIHFGFSILWKMPVQTTKFNYFLFSLLSIEIDTIFARKVNEQKKRSTFEKRFSIDIKSLWHNERVCYEIYMSKSWCVLRYLFHSINFMMPIKQLDQRKEEKVCIFYPEYFKSLTFLNFYSSSSFFSICPVYFSA